MIQHDSVPDFSQCHLALSMLWIPTVGPPLRRRAFALSSKTCCDYATGCANPSRRSGWTTVGEFLFINKTPDVTRVS